MTSEPSSQYSKVAIGLHWLIAVLIIGQLAGGKFMMSMNPSAQQYELFQLHKSFGVIILVLSVARLVWRLTHKAPALPTDMKPFEKLAAKFTHVGFYGLIIGIPISGWLMVSASTTRITTRIFKMVIWPDVPGIPRSEGFENLMKDAHEYMGFAIILLLLLHVGAAIKHHFIDKDNILSRMLPLVKPKNR